MLPHSRNRTYTGANSIVPGDIDDLQDCLVGGKHGPLTHWIPPMSRVANDVNMTFTNGMQFANANAASLNYCPVQLAQGTRITGIRGNLKGTGGAGNISVILTKWTNGVQSTVATLTAVNPANAWANFSHVLAVPVFVLAGEAFWLSASFAPQNQGISALGIDIDRP